MRTVTVSESRAGGGSAAGSTVLNASGYVTARRQATVSSKFTGRVAVVLIEVGLQVEEGPVLARLDDSNLRPALALAALAYLFWPAPLPAVRSVPVSVSRAGGGRAAGRSVLNAAGNGPARRLATVSS